MSIKLTKLTHRLLRNWFSQPALTVAQILAIATIVSMCSQEAMAETHGDRHSSDSVSLNQAFKDAYFTRGKDAYEQSGYFGQINTIFGFTGFPEQHIVKDSKAVDSLYQDAMRQQTEVGSPIMTKDLANPYDTSLLENPDYISTK